MIFTDKGIKANNINIITPPPCCNQLVERVLSSFAYIHAEIKAQNTIFSPVRRENLSKFDKIKAQKTFSIQGKEKFLSEQRELRNLVGVLTDYFIQVKTSLAVLLFEHISNKNGILSCQERKDCNVSQHQLKKINLVISLVYRLN